MGSAKRVIKTQIIQTGKIIENYLVNFPAYLHKESNSIYKLLIDNDKCILKFKFSKNNICLKIPFIFDKPYNYYDFNIDWGDGNYEYFPCLEENITQMIIKHTYELKGEYIVIIQGKYPNLNSNQKNFNNFKNNLTDIINLGNNFDSLVSAFCNCTALKNIPNKSCFDNIFNCSHMFDGCSNLIYLPNNFSLPRYCNNCDFAFANTKLVTLHDNFVLPPTITSCVGLFQNNDLLQHISNNLFNYCAPNIQTLSSVFYNCHNLIDLSNINFSKFNKLNNIDYMCYFNTKLQSINLQIASQNISSYFHTFDNCINLKSFGNLKFNSNLYNISFMFYNCSALNNNISYIWPDLFNHNTIYCLSAFYNCENIVGKAPPIKLWLNHLIDFKHYNMFYNCIKLTNYQYIPISWGGGGQHQTDILYMSLYITSEQDHSFVLPIHKWIDDNEIAEYNFKINYGDNDEWYDVSIKNSYDMNNFWIENNNSFFNGYPRSVGSYIKNAQFDHKKDDMYKKNTVTHLQFISNKEEQKNQFENILSDIDSERQKNNIKNITHFYEKNGLYVITISGTLDTLFVHEQDKWTYRTLRQIGSFNTIKFKTLSHSFCNANKLILLPNEAIPKQITNASYMFYINDTLDKKLKPLNKIPSGFTLHSQLTGCNYMFYDFINNNIININNLLSINVAPSANVEYMFYFNSKLSADNSQISEFINNEPYIKLNDFQKEMIFFNCPLIKLN